ncbi:MAG: pentapeptide repeat-containing protein [Helicobacter sp.]|nr:pentapeptide repeat-containing protein [Helicobacter sp.]
MFSRAKFTGITNFSETIFKNETDFSETIFKNETDFSKAIFKNETIFRAAIFKNEAIFENETIFYATIFENKVDFSKAIFKNETDFSRATFKKEVDFCQAKFTGIINFSAAIFENETDFSFATFEGKVDFRDENLNIKKATFKDNVYFNNSHFCEYADFHECEFEKIACFYGVTFEEVPNFSQAIFKGSLNLVNANLNFDFEDLKEKIQEEYQKFFDEQDKRHLENIANDFRDSFRVFKSALIKENNLLDASNFHKVELYCKEIELKAIWDKKGSKEISEKEMQANAEKFTKFIDSLLLGFYRKLSDHHTDFLKVFNNLILLIALYTLFVFIGGYEINFNKTDAANSLDTYFFIEIKKNIINSSFIQQYHNHILIFLCLICLIGVVIMLYGVFKNIKMMDLKIIKNIGLKDVLKNLWNLFVYLSVLLCALIYLNIYIPKGQDNFSIILNVGIFFAFFIFYLWLVCLNSLFFRYFLIVSSYICVVVAIGVNVATLNPFIGKLVDDSPNNPPFIVITFAYTILMFLVLFSLQKTARKNSIVPS